MGELRGRRGSSERKMAAAYAYVGGLVNKEKTCTGEQPSSVNNGERLPKGGDVLRDCRKFVMSNPVESGTISQAWRLGEGSEKYFAA